MVRCAPYEGLYATSWRGADLGAIPSFDGSDLWSPFATTDGSLPCGYAVGHTVVLALGAGVQIALPFVDVPEEVPLVLTIDRAIVSMELSPDHVQVTKGIIAGVLDTDGYCQAFADVAGYFDQGLCAGSTLDSVLAQFRQASDIMTDGTQDPSKTCDGISIGLGFRGSLISLGTPQPLPPPPPDPCK